MFLTKRLIHNLVKTWRRGRDLNSRTPCEVSGFQDRHVRPLRHPSVLSFQAVTSFSISGAVKIMGEFLTSCSTASTFRDGVMCP
jgi:hypothetical protein